MRRNGVTKCLRIWKKSSGRTEQLGLVGQTIVFCRPLPRAFGPRDFVKNRLLRWGMLQLANRPEGRGFSTLSGGVAVATMTDHQRRWSVPLGSSSPALLPAGTARRGPAGLPPALPASEPQLSPKILPT